MREFVVVIVAFQLAASTGCNTSFENEALKVAKDQWKLTKLGGSFYLCEITEARHSGRLISTPASKTLYELRNHEFKVFSRSLSEADKLNGIEWFGWVHLKADAFRRYSPQPLHGSKLDKTWSDWISADLISRKSQAFPTETYVDSMVLVKTKGKWKVENAPDLLKMFYSDITFKQVEWSDLPK